MKDMLLHASRAVAEGHPSAKIHTRGCKEDTIDGTARKEQSREGFYQCDPHATAIATKSWAIRRNCSMAEPTMISSRLQYRSDWYATIGKY
jgi:hypothetical protein